MSTHGISLKLQLPTASQRPNAGESSSSSTSTESSSVTQLKKPTHSGHSSAREMTLPSCSKVSPTISPTSVASPQTEHRIVGGCSPMSIPLSGSRHHATTFVTGGASADEMETFAPPGRWNDRKGTCRAARPDCADEFPARTHSRDMQNIFRCRRRPRRRHNDKPLQNPYPSARTPCFPVLGDDEGAGPNFHASRSRPSMRPISRRSARNRRARTVVEALEAPALVPPCYLSAP